MRFLRCLRRRVIYRLAIWEMEHDPDATALFRNTLNQSQLGTALNDYVPHIWTR